ncbi:hypothetical protein JN27_11225 [Massilia sp. BSC265]|nr:hypothetical protein JN27_11225 [Massilia sp. BSC265]
MFGRAQDAQRYPARHPDLFHEQQGRVDAMTGAQLQPFIDLASRHEIGACIVSALLNHVLPPCERRMLAEL